MAEHMPGPWTLNWWTVNDSPKEWRVVVKGNEAHAVADYIRSEADARLIASAPDLLAALEAIEDQLLNSNERAIFPTSGTFLAARAAIAKARGEAKTVAP